MKAIIALLAWIVLESCTFRQNSEEFIIKGSVKNIPGKTIYLADIYNYTQIIDSVPYVNDRFEFKLNEKSETYVAGLYYKDQNGKLLPLRFKNKILSEGSKIYSYAGFILEKGTILISGDMKNFDQILDIEHGKQTDVLYKFQMENFGMLNNSNPESRKNGLEKVRKAIEEYPYSWYLISSLFNNKEQYKVEELKEILPLFSGELKKTNIFEEFNKSLDFRIGIKESIHEIKLTTPDLSSKFLFANSSDLNLIIFWASWCGPCRLEIPDLKKLHEEFKNNSRIRFISVSIDESKDEWQKALTYEKMGWDQFLVPSKDLNKIKSQFNFSPIPTTVFADGKGNILLNVVGFQKDNAQKYRMVISKFLNLKQK